tara:strand:+ start:1069 stop:1260 length:192 start_codon:yes stop_codon:yes gene_type:complete
MEDIMDLYLTLSKSATPMNPRNVNNIIKDNIKNKKICLEDRWLLEIIKSFYNIGYENGMKDNN